MKQRNDKNPMFIQNIFGTIRSSREWYIFFFPFFYFYFFTRRPGSVIVRDQWTWEEEMAPNFKYLKVPPIYQKIKTSSFGPFFRSLAHNIYIIVVTSFINIYIYICIDLILFLALTQTRFSVTDSIYIFFLLNWVFFFMKIEFNQYERWSK